MQKILIFASHFYPHAGGVERYVEEVYLRLVLEGDREVHIVTISDEGDRYELYKGLHIHRVKKVFSIGSIFLVPHMGEWNKCLSRLFSEHSFTVINTHTRFFASSFLGARAAKKQKIRHIHTEHGASAVVHSSPIIRYGSLAFDLTLGKYVMTKADLVIAISRKGVDFCKSMGAKEVVYVPNGIDADFWKPAGKKGEKRDALRLLYVGRMVEAKGVSHLFSALSSLSAQWSLSMVGNGEAESSFKEEAVRLGIQDRVIFRGRLSKEEIKEELSQADLFVNPSLNEGLPTTVLESLAMGVPTVATDVGGTSEITVLVPEYSRLVQPADSQGLASAISELVATEHKKTPLEVHEIIEKEYGWKSVVKKLGEIFD
jgi:glycosyltransferase involved in cell wall biosynthesis